MEKPNRSIIFAVFDGEDIGLVDSSFFANNPVVNIKGGECINLEMIGSIKSSPLNIEYTNNSETFAKDIIKKALPYSSGLTAVNDTSASHSSFNKAGMKSVTLSSGDTAKKHTAYDDINNFSKENLEDTIITLNAFLRSKGISPMPNPYMKVYPVFRYDIYGSILGAFLVVILIHFFSKKQVK